MTVRKRILFTLSILLISAGNIFSKGVQPTAFYRNLQEVQQVLKETQQKHNANTMLHTIATSPGGEPVNVLEIGSNLKNVPAVFVGANFEGDIPLATEGALRLIQMLIDSADYTTGLKWYILPMPNPDAAKNFFAKVKYGRTVNDFKINNDGDDAINEDGYDDLNGDGFITRMRVRSIDGTYVASKADPRIMVPANVRKGERGEYKLYTEGIDNDGDGLYNEDGEGGINVGIAFPHLFPEKNKEAGLWPGQAPEVYGLLRFIFDRPEIAMVFTLGSSDFCISPPKGGRKGEISYDRITLPARYARMFNTDAGRTYTMDEVLEMFREHVPAETDLTPDRVAGMLGLGAVVNPLENDMRFYTEFSNEYNKYLLSKNFSTDNLSPVPAKDGSFELWAYYHLGVPSFSMNLFTVPRVAEEKFNGKDSVSPDDAEKMSPEEFIALGEEKITSFLKAFNAQEKFTSDIIITRMKDGRMTPEQLVIQLRQLLPSAKENQLSDREKALLAWSDNEWDGQGFVEWQKYRHPDLGEVEIGGFVPYLETTPKAEHIDSLLNIKLPWLLQLTKKMPRIAIAGEELTDLGSGILRLDLYIENKGPLSYPIAMGQRNNQPAPVIILLEGDFELLEGLMRTPVRTIGGNQVRKFTWLLKTGKKAVITARIESAVFPEEVKQINTGGRL